MSIKLRKINIIEMIIILKFLHLNICVDCVKKTLFFDLIKSKNTIYMSATICFKQIMVLSYQFFY